MTVKQIFLDIQVIIGKKIGQPQSQSQICIQTELDDTKSCYQLIITITISKKKKKKLVEQISLIETMSSVKNFSILEIPHFYLGQLGVAMVIV